MEDKKWVIPLAKRATLSPKEDIWLLIALLIIFGGLGGGLLYVAIGTETLTNIIIVGCIVAAFLGFIAFWYGHNIYNIIKSNKAYKYTCVYHEDNYLVLYDVNNRKTRIPFHDVQLVEGRPKSMFAVGPMIASYRDHSYGSLIFYCNNQGRSFKLKVKFTEAPIEAAAKIIDFYNHTDRLYDTEDEFIG